MHVLMRVEPDNFHSMEIARECMQEGPIGGFYFLLPLKTHTGWLRAQGLWAMVAHWPGRISRPGWLAAPGHGGSPRVHGCRTGWPCRRVGRPLASCGPPRRCWGGALGRWPRCWSAGRASSRRERPSEHQTRAPMRHGQWVQRS